MSGFPNSGVLVERIRSKSRWTLALWLVGAVSWLYLAVLTEFQLLAISVWSIPFLLLIAALSTPWRSISWSSLLAFFLLGMGPLVALVVGTQRLIGLTPLEDWLRTVFESWAEAGFDVKIVFPSTVLFAPVIEELFKVIPLLILVLWRKGAFRVLSGPLDYAVVAGATGAGLGFGEDVLVYLTNGIQGPPSSTFALGLGPFYRSLVGSQPGTPFGQSDFADNMSFFFPEMQEIFGVVFSGHGAYSLGLGLSMGLAVWGVRRLRKRWLYLAIPITYLWVVWEHMMVNWYGGAACDFNDLPLCTVANLDLRGRLFPFAVLAAWGLAIYVGSKAVRYHRAEDVQTASNEIDRMVYRQRGWRGWLDLTRDWLEFRRWRRKTAYGTEHLRSPYTPTRRHVAATVAARLRALGIQLRLQGRDPEPLSPDQERLIRSAAPID